MSLTDEDKQWIGDQLDRVAGGVMNEFGRFATKNEVDRFGAKIMNEFDRFATKDEFDGFAAKVMNEFDRFATKEDLERIETTLLTEFHKWASPLEARQRTHTATLRAMDLEMEALSERVEKLENPPPPSGSQ